MTACVSESSLGRAEDIVEIGRGGEGIVYALRSRPNEVFKKFKSRSGHGINRPVLERLVGFPQQLSDSDRDILLSRTAWPTTVVEQGNTAVGFLMPRIPDRFFRKHGVRLAPKRVLCEWNYLSLRNRYNTNPNIVSEVPRFGATESMSLVRDLAATMDILHKNNVVVGDISGRNLIWTDLPQPMVYIIDCDSFHFEGEGGVAGLKQTPDWDDPALPLNDNTTTLDSDRYKLALAAYRAIWAASTDRLGGKAAPENREVPDAVMELVRRGNGLQNRPTAREWVDALDQISRFKGRTVLSIDQTNPVSRPVAHRQPSNSSAPGGNTGGIPRGDRPVIPMKPSRE